jgi:hypothetical protein
MNVPMAGAPMPINGEFTLTREGWFNLSKSKKRGGLSTSFFV